MDSNTIKKTQQRAVLFIIILLVLLLVFGIIVFVYGARLHALIPHLQGPDQARMTIPLVFG